MMENDALSLEYKLNEGRAGRQVDPLDFVTTRDETGALLPLTGLLSAALPAWIAHGPGITMPPVSGAVPAHQEAL